MCVPRQIEPIVSLLENPARSSNSVILVPAGLWRQDSACSRRGVVVEQGGGTLHDPSERDGDHSDGQRAAENAEKKWRAGRRVKLGHGIRRGGNMFLSERTAQAESPESPVSAPALLLVVNMSLHLTIVSCDGVLHLVGWPISFYL